MKLFNKTLFLALVGSLIIFSAGCVAKARRPVPFDTEIAGASSSNNQYAATATPDGSSTSTVATSGLAGAYNAGAFNAGPQNVFGAVNSGASATQGATQGADTLSARTDGGIEANGQIRGITSLPPVYFDFDRYAIKTSEFSKIQALKDYLARNPTQKVLIEGYCDWRGTAEYNMALGDRRANAVKRYAIRIGIPADKIQTLSLGSTKAAERGTEAEMAKDRRGEIVILVK